MTKNVPYKPSWVDHFLDWLNGLPIPIWLSIVLVYLIVVLSFHIAIWIDGVQPVGSVDRTIFFDGLWSVVPLAFLLTLDRIAHRALDKFAVLVPDKKKEIEDLRYQMTNIPARFVFGLTLFMALVISAAIYVDPSFLYEFHNPVSYVIFGFFVILSYSFAPILLYHSFRQLNLVTRAYRMVREINLFHLQPLYAFSGLAMASSFFWILILNMNIFGNFVLEQSSGTDLLLSYAFNAPLLFLTFATFLLPLWGIHKRIQTKKETALEDNGFQVQKVHQNLYRQLDKADYKRQAIWTRHLAVSTRCASRSRRCLPGRGTRAACALSFSAVFLPLALWLVQQFLRGLFSL